MSNTEITDGTAKKLRNLVPFKEGFDPRRNLKGRPEGATWDMQWTSAIEKIAAEQGMTNDEAEVELLVTAYKQAKKGNSTFFKEIMDRKFGKVKESIEHSGAIGVIPIFGGESVKQTEE